MHELQPGCLTSCLIGEADGEDGGGSECAEVGLGRRC
jgi:hypothetical protein